VSNEGRKRPTEKTMAETGESPKKGGKLIHPVELKRITRLWERGPFSGGVKRRGQKPGWRRKKLVCGRRD